jgi:hypothetical protein
MKDLIQFIPPLEIDEKAIALAEFGAVVPEGMTPEDLAALFGRLGGLMGPCPECGGGVDDHEYPCSRHPLCVDSQDSSKEKP